MGEPTLEELYDAAVARVELLERVRARYEARIAELEKVVEVTNAAGERCMTMLVEKQVRIAELEKVVRGGGE